MNSPGFSIYDMVARNAGLYPDQAAIVQDGQGTTFGAYQNLCDRYAMGLVREGLAAGDRIAVIAGNSLDFLILCGAAAKIGAIVVPVNWRLGVDEVAYILNDTTPQILVSGKAYGDLARQASVNVASLKKHYMFDPDAQAEDGIPFAALGREAERLDTNAVSVDRPYMIIHTAAVGGKPKGSVLSQANLVAAALQIAQLLSLNHRDCHIGTLPLFHIGGLAMSLAVMYQGGRNVLMDRFDPPAVWDLIENEQGTFLVTFPPMLGAILDAQEKAPGKGSSLRVICGVDSPETIERFLNMNPQAGFCSLYGQTEAMPVSGGDYRAKPGSIGKPAILTRIALLDDLDREAPAGMPGEICVRSASVFQGYWNLAEETAYAFRNGWHHTGDLGRRDADGFLWYAGRKPEKELIKPGGENVYPAEVEQVILSHGAIEAVCVIGVPDPQWGEAVKAVCILKPGARVSAGELSEFVAAKIARYKKPKYVVFVEDLPKTANGAIDREAVKNTHRGS